MGVVTGAVSAGLGQVFSASGFWATVGNGALAGAGGGGVTSLINGDAFLEGVLKGAVIGGVVGAVSYTINFYAKGYDKMKNITEDIEIPGYEQNGEYFKNEADLKNFVDNNIGNTDIIEKTLKTDIQLASPNNLPSNNYVLKDNILMKGKMLIGGVTTSDIGF